MHTVGRHLLVELYDCDAAALDDLGRVRRAVRAAARAAKVTVVAEAYHRFRPHGVSASLLIAESHFSLHTWPEARYAAADLYTCGDLDPAPGITALVQALGARSLRQVEIARGLARDLFAARLQLPASSRRVTRLARRRIARD